MVDSLNPSAPILALTLAGKEALEPEQDRRPLAA